MPKILVKTPVTTNGRDPLLRNGQQVFKTTIVEANAKSIFEKMNAKLPEHLKRSIAPYNEPVQDSDIPVERKKYKKNDTE